MTSLPRAQPLAPLRPPAARPKRNNKVLLAYLYILPAIVIMLVMTYYPMAFNIWMSFTDYGLKNLRVDAPLPAFVALDNYLGILDNSIGISNFDFGRMLAFNLFWTFSNVIFHVVIGVLIAVVLNVEGLRFRGIYRAIFVLPIILPTLVVATVWRNMFDADFGAINQGLAAAGGLIGIAPSAFHIRWLEQVDDVLPGLPLSYFALLITNIWLGWPFNTIVATGALQSISKEYYEAAEMDGATGVQQFMGITVPLLRPAMIPAAMYGMIVTFNLFNLIFFVSAGGPLRKTEILVTTAYRLVNEQRLYGVAAAFGVYTMIILLVLTLATNRIAKATESYDA